MKKLIFIVAPLVLLTSCDLSGDLFEDDDNPYEVVREESVLQVVKDSLEARHPGAVPQSKLCFILLRAAGISFWIEE